MVQYILENGLRRVKPYFFTHKTNCKGRWFGKTILEVFTAEFRDRPSQYYYGEIKNGNFKIFTRSSEIIQGDILVDYQIKNGDRVEYTQHHHEPVVPSTEPVVIYEDENLLVVDKPSGIPVHPTQKYFYNSVTEIVQLQKNLNQLVPCHRLDKLTSGVLILGKSNKAAAKLQQLIQDKSDVEKLYIARVLGEFPANEIVCNDSVVNVQTKKSFANGNPESKPATTIFNVLHYNKVLNHSTVMCQPITGRTHQIRIHLRNLGFPIVNDPLYGEHGLLHKVRNDIDESNFNKLIDKADLNRESLISGEKCQVCDADLYHDYKLETLVLWLHSLRYKVGGLVFETEMPQWSKINTV